VKTWAVNNIWNQLAIWYLDGRTQCQPIICNYCGLELHWLEERCWSWQPVASGNAGCCDYVYDYLLTICIQHFFSFSLTLLRSSDSATSNRIIFYATSSREKKSKEKSKHKKRFNFTQSGGIKHRIPLRLPTSTSSAHQLVNNQTRIMLICIIHVSVRRPYIVIRITCSVTYYIILVLYYSGHWSYRRHNTLLLFMEAASIGRIRSAIFLTWKNNIHKHCRGFDPCIFVSLWYIRSNYKTLDWVIFK